MNVRLVPPILAALLVLAGVLAAGPQRPAPPPPHPPQTAPPPSVPDSTSTSSRPASPADTRAPTDLLPPGMPDDLAGRLSALRPSAPDAYLRLGEDVAAAAQESRGKDLARRLLGLAFVLDRKRAATSVSPVASSAALALAEIASTEADRRWFTSLARSLDRRLASPPWTSRGVDSGESDTAYLACVFVGLVRGGDSIRAQRVIAQPGVRDLLLRYERLLSPMNATGGLSALEREMSRWPCPECAGKRIVRKYQSNPPQFRLCSVCAGTLGPTLRPEDLAAQLRFEARLLSGTARSWAAQVISDGGPPLRDVDPDELPAVLGIDPSATLWRAGAWVQDGAAAPKKPTVAPAADPASPSAS